MPDHRVPLLGDGWRRFEEPERSRDPRVLAVVRELDAVRELGRGDGCPTPAPVFREELRAQLVAITPRIVAETIAAEAAMVDIVPRPIVASTAPQHADVRRTRRFDLKRVLTVAAVTITAFALLLGGAVALSHRALPGDTLYGLKRADERFQLATDGSDTERAMDLLSFASTRTDEAQRLLERSSASAAGRGAHAAAAVNSSTAALIIEALSSADSDVSDASRLLAKQAVGARYSAPLSNMTHWAPIQYRRLTTLRAATTDPSLRAAAWSSMVLVRKAQTRATTLSNTVGQQCQATAGSDTLGPKPCSSGSTPGVKVTAVPRSTRVPTAPIGGASPLRPVTGSPVRIPSRPALGTSTTPASSTPPAPGRSHKTTTAVVPPLPTPSVSVPVSVGSCGVSVGLGGIHLGLGACSGAPVSVGP